MDFIIIVGFLVYDYFDFALISVVGDPVCKFLVDVMQRPVIVSRGCIPIPSDLINTNSNESTPRGMDIINLLMHEH